MFALLLFALIFRQEHNFTDLRAYSLCKGTLKHTRKCTCMVSTVLKFYAMFKTYHLLQTTV